MLPRLASALPGSLLGSVALGRLRLGLGLWLGLGLSPACGGETACTQLGCESEAVVTYAIDLFPGEISGPYELVLEGEGETATARCLDPAAPETADNPAGLSCDAQGFSLVGHPLANERELVVTIALLETDETVTGPVRLEAVEEVTPNGPDCPPLCVVRNGQLRPGAGS